MIFAIAKIVNSDNGAALRSKLVELMAAKKRNADNTQSPTSLPRQPICQEKCSEIPKSATCIYIRQTERLGSICTSCSMHHEYHCALIPKWKPILSSVHPRPGHSTRVRAYTHRTTCPEQQTKDHELHRGTGHQVC